MSVRAISKLIFELYADKGLAQKFKSTPEVVMAEFDLTPEEKRALLERDYAFMYCSGVHPALVDHMFQLDFVSNFKEMHGVYVSRVVPKIKLCSNPYQDYYNSEKNTA